MPIIRRPKVRVVAQEFDEDEPELEVKTETKPKAKKKLSSKLRLNNDLDEENDEEFISRPAKQRTTKTSLNVPIFSQFEDGTEGSEANIYSESLKMVKNASKDVGTNEPHAETVFHFGENDELVDEHNHELSDKESEGESERESERESDKGSDRGNDRIDEEVYDLELSEDEQISKWESVKVDDGKIGQSPKIGERSSLPKLNRIGDSDLDTELARLHKTLEEYKLMKTKIKEDIQVISEKKQDLDKKKAAIRQSLQDMSERLTQQNS